jgi:hypothetical protein
MHIIESRIKKARRSVFELQFAEQCENKSKVKAFLAIYVIYFLNQ